MRDGGNVSQEREKEGESATSVNRGHMVEIDKKRPIVSISCKSQMSMRSGENDRKAFTDLHNDVLWCSLFSSCNTISCFVHSSTCMSTPTKVFFIDGKSSSLHFRVSQHQWKYITEKRQSTPASTLTINHRVRGPCRVREKLVLADEKGAWRRRTLHLKWASVNTEIEEMEQREKAEREMSRGCEKDSGWAVVCSTKSHSPSLLTTRHLVNTCSDPGIKTGRNWAVEKHNVPPSVLEIFFFQTEFNWLKMPSLSLCRDRGIQYAQRVYYGVLQNYMNKCVFLANKLK